MTLPGYKNFEKEVKAALQKYWTSLLSPTSSTPYSPTIYQYNNLLRNESIIYHPRQMGNGKTTRGIWWLSNRNEIKFYSEGNSLPDIFGPTASGLDAWISKCLQKLNNP